MDPEKYHVRPFRDSDYEAYALLRNQYRPARPLNGPELRSRTKASLATGGVRRWYLVVEAASGRPVAQAALDQRSTNFHPQKFWVNIVVAAEHQGRGIGRTLARLLEGEAGKHDAIVLWSEVRADVERGVEFFQRQGFQELRHRRLSRLDLEAANVDRLPDRTAALRSHGIELTTLAAEGPERDEVRTKYYELVRASDRDVPDLGDRAPLSYEQFVRSELESPGFFPEGTFLAKTSSEFVGVTSLERAALDPESVRIGFTGTSPRYRHQGIATELKRRSIALARHMGYRWMDTGNDSANHAIGSINERLGFRTIATYLLGEKRLRPDNGPSRKGPPPAPGPRGMSLVPRWPVRFSGPR